MPASSSRRLRLVVLTAVAGVALAGCSSGGNKDSGGTEPAKPTNTVAIKNFKFVPAAITVKAGTVIVT